MKFEVDYKTGIIVTPSNIPEVDPLPVIDTELEIISQAVKKTQEKLENKSIQKIQDSDTISQEEFDEMLLKRNIITPHMGAISIEMIEQNQNIRESVKTILETALAERERLIPLLTDKNQFRDISQKEFDRVCVIIDHLRAMYLHHTGKDIKELEK